MSKALGVIVGLITGGLILKKVFAKPEPVVPEGDGALTLSIIDAKTGQPVPRASRGARGYGAITGGGPFTVKEGGRYFLIGSIKNNSKRTVGTVTTDEPATFSLTITGAVGSPVVGFNIYGPAGVALAAAASAVWQTYGTPPNLTGELPFTIPDRVGATTGTIVGTAIAPDGSIAARSTITLVVQAIVIVYGATITLGISG